jgi:hypothetical protein
MAPLDPPLAVPPVVAPPEPADVEPPLAVPALGVSSVSPFWVLPQAAEKENERTENVAPKRRTVIVSCFGVALGVPNPSEKSRLRPPLRAANPCVIH